jgi:Ca-activated chloride channel family protein
VAAVLGSLLVLSAAACTGSDDEPAAGGDTPPSPDATQGNGAGADRDGCIVVDMAVSSEKISLLENLADEFNESGAEIEGQCIDVRPRSVASGRAATLIPQGWPDPEANGPPPVVWSPAASAWGAIVNQRAGAELAPAGTPFLLTPLVIAMPQPMAEALGYPDTPIGFSDLARLAQDPEGWASVGHPEWGPFRLGKTNPNFSTSGLNFTIAEYYAATGKTFGLTTEDIADPAARQFAADIESAVVHYGDITMTFLNNWFAADRRGTALTYVSAVAVEEKSVIDYNLGDPDGVLEAGETLRPPRVPLVAIYPEEGTLYSDSPFIVLDTDWVSPEQAAAAALFEEFVQLPENQERVMEFGFRPNNPAVTLTEPISLANGVDPGQPTAELEVPEPEVLVGILDSWAELRKEARVMILLDVSGSMGDFADESSTKLDLAVEAALGALDEFKDTDQVGLTVFTTSPSTDEPAVREVVPVGPMSTNRALIAAALQEQFPGYGTPLYDATAQTYQSMVDGYDPEAINAVVLLSDGQNDDGTTDDDDDQFDALIEQLTAGTEGGSAQPVRVFTISYGSSADRLVLRTISEATNAATYDSSDPTTIERVFTAVISNF